MADESHWYTTWWIWLIIVGSIVILLLIISSIVSSVQTSNEKAENVKQLKCLIIKLDLLSASGANSDDIGKAAGELLKYTMNIGFNKIMDINKTVVNEMTNDFKFDKNMNHLNEVEFNTLKNYYNNTCGGNKFTGNFVENTNSKSEVKSKLNNVFIM